MDRWDLEAGSGWELGLVLSPLAGSQSWSVVLRAGQFLGTVARLQHSDVRAAPTPSCFRSDTWLPSPLTRETSLRLFLKVDINGWLVSASLEEICQLFTGSGRKSFDLMLLKMVTINCVCYVREQGQHKTFNLLWFFTSSSLSRLQNCGKSGL